MSSNLPRQCKGRKITCAICGMEGFERDGNFTKQRGLNVCKWDFDKVLDRDRPKN
jgi:hypothetical protein